jgi:hypothetical protein
LTGTKPLFASKEISKTIGYFDNESAYDLTGALRCHYNEGTGNLSDPATGKIVGHISLEGKFVGTRWLEAELFPAPTTESAQVAGSSNEDTEGDRARSDSSDADIERALKMVRATLGQS